MHAPIRAVALAGGLALLAACGGPAGSDNLAELDARLTNGVANASDNAVDGNAVEAAPPADNAALAAAGGSIEKAPEAVEVPPGVDTGERTLGDLARQQRAGGAGTGGTAQGAAASGGSCAQAVQAGPEWAERMPVSFRPYPGARLNEAAGIDRAQCQLVIVSFASAASIDQIIDYYYTQARRAGYDGEHQRSGTEHRLGGTRASDGAAYVVFVRPGERGGTDVDIVASPD